MEMFKRGMLGPVPFSLILFLITVSFFGSLSAFLIQLACRDLGVTWRSALAVTLCLAALCAFNCWHFVQASAAV